jgi:V-type H+-transporting ATPase subunit d
MLGIEAAYVNMDDGFVEAMLRSLRKGFLDDNQYSQLKQTSTITEFKLVLEDSDYGASVFENQDSNSDFEVALLRRQMKQKLADELRFMHS